MWAHIKLIIKLKALGLNPALVVKVGNITSTPLILNTGAPQGCVLSPLLYSLFTHECVAQHTTNSIIKFADDTTAVGLNTNDDETVYREELRALGVWCLENNLSLNVNKTRKMILNFRNSRGCTLLSTSMGPQWRRWKTSCSLAYTSLTN
jgi:hypothetical protein